MDNVYQGGKIYKITSEHSNKYYIGSTINSLNTRFSLHKNYYKQFKEQKHNNKLTVFDLFDLGECSISLVEQFPCNTKRELLDREGQIIRERKADLLNKVINGRTHKEYCQDNPDRVNGIKLRWALKTYDCDSCNCKVQKGNKFNHTNSKKHIESLLIKGLN
jgi:predicted GIY-YIG superfamily endonuclease